MKKSEKILLATFLGTLGAFVVVPAIWTSFIRPVQQQQDLLDTETRKLDKATDAVALSMSQVRRMVDFKERSLSSNSSQGANAYQQWLTDLAEIVAAFRNPVVSTERVALSRDKSFSTIRVRIDGEGTAEQLQTFLFRFHRANVLHRIAGMNIEALDNSAHPRLSLRITAEALSLASADEKGPTLFQRTTVSSLRDGRLTVESADGFPQEAPFEIRIGSTYVIVTDVKDGVWQIDLPDGQTIAAAENEIVELSPVHPDFAEATLSDFAAFVEQNPFAKPAPYEPRIDLIGSKSVERGQSLELTARATGFPAGDGDVVYEFVSEVPEGMMLDGDRLIWSPAEEMPAGEQKVAVRASGGGLREPVEAEFTLVLKEVNTPPTLELATDEKLSVTIGQSATISVKAADRETPADELKLAVGPDAPEGVVFDEEARVFRFTPASGSQIGDIEIPVQVTDTGETPQTTTLRIAVRVEDDKAQFTVFTGMVAADNDRQVWLRDQSTNQKIVLRKGERLQYAGFDAEVLDIGSDFFTFQQNNQTMKLELGQTLRDALVVARLDPAPARSPANMPPEGKPTAEEPTAEEPTAEEPAAAPASDPPAAGEAAEPGEKADESAGDTFPAAEASAGNGAGSESRPS